MEQFSAGTMRRLFSGWGFFEIAVEINRILSKNKLLGRILTKAFFILSTFYGQKRKTRRHVFTINSFARDRKPGFIQSGLTIMRSVRPGRLPEKLSVSGWSAER
jgi:hypothetical protein